MKDNTLVKRIRNSYLENPYLGLAMWFDEFDRALLKGKFEVCQTLLQEIQAEEYAFSEKERKYVASRHGALMLCAGLKSHQEKDYFHARRCYSVSRSIHHGLQNPDGEGQVIAAQWELEKIDREQNIDLLKHLQAQPRVIGNNDELLSGRIESATSAQHLQIIAAAREYRCGHSVLKLVQAEDLDVRSTAMVALPYVQPAPAKDLLLSMLNSADWTVCWVALIILQQQMREKTRKTDLDVRTILSFIYDYLATSTTNVILVHEMVILLKLIGDARCVPTLLILLDDLDTEILSATIDALKSLGDERALAKLAGITENIDFFGNPLQKLAENASAAIRERNGSTAKQEKRVKDSENTPLVSDLTRSSYNRTVTVAEQPSRRGLYALRSIGFFLFGFCALITFSAPILPGLLLKSWWLVAASCVISVLLFIRSVTLDIRAWIGTLALPFGIAYAIAAWQAIPIAASLPFLRTFVISNPPLFVEICALICYFGYMYLFFHFWNNRETLPGAIGDTLNITALSILAGRLSGSLLIFWGTLLSLFLLTILSTFLQDRRIHIWPSIFCLPFGLGWGIVCFLLAQLIPFPFPSDIVKLLLPLIGFTIGFSEHLYALKKLDNFVH